MCPRVFWLEARKSMSNCKICFCIFSEVTDTFSKIFSQHGLTKCGVRIFGRKFWLGCLSAFKPFFNQITDG